MHDLVLRGGTLVDGTGAPPFRGDVAIRGDRIVAVGSVSGSAWRTLDVTDRVVTPGFVDPHTHLDAQLMWDPLGTPACWQGTTTVVIGNCGVSFAPVRPADRELLARTLEAVEEIPAESILASVTWGWETFGGYLDALDARPLGLNVAGLVGHAALRFHAMGLASVEPDRQPSAAELDTMRAMLDEAMQAGALGFSTSRTRSHQTPAGVPIPGTFAGEEELFALADVLAQRGKGLVQWVQGFGEEDRTPEFPHARREIARMAETSRRSALPVVFSTFTHALLPTLHRLVLAWAAEEGTHARIRPMFNPRTGVSLYGLANRSPVRSRAWKELYSRSPAERMRALGDEGVHRRLVGVREDVDERAGGELWLFGPERCVYDPGPDDRLGAVARNHGERPVETIVRLLRETGGRQLFASAGSNQVPEHVEEMLDHPDLLIGLGDAGAHVTAICDSSLTTWTLTHWHRARGRFTLAEAVRRITSDPADAFGIPERGRLEPGRFADVNVIDLDALDIEVPEFVHDFPCGAGRWTQRARGYEYTLVNGAIVIENGNHTGRLPGRVVRT